MVDSTEPVLREVKLGKSKIDFKVGNIYIEVKTPLLTINVKYGKNFKTKKKSISTSTERMAKHVQDLAKSLKEEERAILLVVNQYRITENKPFYKSKNFKKMKKIITDSINAGVEFWNLELNFSPEGVSIHQLKETTNEVLKIK